MNQISVRKATEVDVPRIVTLSNQILEYLKSNQKSDYFGGVDEDEVRQSMEKPSIVLVSVNGNNEIIGFLLLQKHNEKEIILNGYGVNPNMQQHGIATKMLKKAKEYSVALGFTTIIGTIHPENKASMHSIAHIAKNVSLGQEFIHQTKDGRKLRRKNFSISL